MATRVKPQASPLYLAVPRKYLPVRFDVGLVHLDKERRVVGMNDYARRVLSVEHRQPFDRMVQSFHPERSQPKAEFLLDASGQCPVADPPPMTMIINIPERVLLIKISRMGDAAGAACGFVPVTYDITDFVSGESSAGTQRRLAKIPTVADPKIVFVDADDILSIEAYGRYTRVVTAGASQFCDLSIGDIETRLDPEQFMRVHRGYLVNVRAVNVKVFHDRGRCPGS